MTFEEYAKMKGLYLGEPMKTEPKYQHPTTQVAWEVWKHLKGKK